MERAVAIVGIGTVSASGCTLDEVHEALRHGRPQLREVDADPARGGARLAALCGKLDVRDRIPMLAARRMSPPSRHAVLAAQLALEGARIELPSSRDPTTSITLATAFGPIHNTQALLDQLIAGGFRTVLPAGFTECVANAPAAQVAIQCRIAGPCRALVGREASPLLALRRAAADVARGNALRALAGSVEEATPLLHSLLDRFGALARVRDGSPERARPFDRRRNGCLLAEGATLLVLECEQSARTREAPILARILAVGSAFDPTASRVGWGHGAPLLADAIRACLRQRDIDLGTIDAVVTGASGSRSGDRIEASLLRELWPRRMPPVVAPKAVTGEYGGAFLAAALLTLEGWVPGSGGEAHEADPALGVEPCRDRRLPQISRVLVTSVASGGPAAWAVLARA